MIRAIAFDLDNTLIDFMTFKRETAKVAAAAMVNNGLKAKVSDVSKQIFEIYDEYSIEYQKTFSILLWDRYKIHDLNRFEKIQQAGIVAYLGKKFEVLKPYPNVKSVLKKLKKHGLKLCIVTDAPRNKAWQRLNICGLQDQFDLVITFDDTKVHKPHQLPFKTLLRKTMLKPGEVLFVGDNPEKDIKGAKKIGMKTILVIYGQQEPRSELEMDKPDYVIKDISELLDILC